MFVINGLRETVSYINQPAVKAGVKNFSGIVTFSLGAVEGCDLVYRAIKRDQESSLTAGKSIALAGRFSLVLSAALSYPGQWVASNTIGRIVDPALFGPNVIFAVNPYHPRHLVSFASCGLTLSASVYFLLFKKDKEERAILNDQVVTLLLFFNLATSRPVLHLGNQFAHQILWKS
jgi:hypothetical protein